MTYREKIDQERAIKKAEEEIKAFEYHPVMNYVYTGYIHLDEYGKCIVPTWAYKEMINEVYFGFDLLRICDQDYYTGVMLRI